VSIVETLVQDLSGRKIANQSGVRPWWTIRSGFAFWIACFMFIPTQAYAVPLFPAQVFLGDASFPSDGTTADFNRDGNADLVLVNKYHSSISVFLGDGSGAFASALNFNTGVSPIKSTAGDFNGDGNVDIVTFNRYSSNYIHMSVGVSVSIFLGDGKGGFAPVVTFPLLTKVTALAVADLNGDGQADLVEMDDLGGLDVQLADGLGGFVAPVKVVTPGSVSNHVTSTITGDFNGDGRVDLVQTMWGETRVLLGDGLGGFGMPQVYAVGGDHSAITTADFNGDGKADLAIASNVSGQAAVNVLLGDGLGGFSVSVKLSKAVMRAMSITTADFNGDGNADIAAGLYGGKGGGFLLLLGDGLGGFAAPVRMANESGLGSVFSADFNGDGKADLAGVNYFNNVTVFLGNGVGGFTVPLNSPPFKASSASIITADFNGDGKADIASPVDGQTGTAEVRVQLGDGLGGFATPVKSVVGVGTVFAMGTADFNGDGNVDLALLSQISAGTSEIRVLLGDGLGSFTASAKVAMGTYISAITTADFNGDGNVDLALAGYTLGWYGEVVVLLGDGVGGFAAPVHHTGHHGTPVSIITADFNGDGNADVATDSGSSWASIDVWFGDGLGAFAPAVAVTLPLGLSGEIITADFNGDGNADIAGLSGLSVIVLLGDGLGNFALSGVFGSGFPVPAYSILTGSTATNQGLTISSGDFNNDGKADIVQGNDGGVTVWLADGAGGLSAAGHFASGDFGLAPARDGGGRGNAIGSVTSADFNGDGKRDLALMGNYFSAGSGFATISVLLNQLSSLNTIPTPLKPKVPVALLGLSTGDINGNGTADMAVLGKRISTGRYVIRVKDTGMVPALIREIPLSGTFQPIQMVTLADMNANGSPEIAVLEVDPATGKNGQIQVKDSRTGALITNIRIRSTVKPHMLVALPDVNGNGSADLALSEVDPVTGNNVQIQVKDGRTGAKIANIRVNTAVKPYQLIALASVNGAPALALSEVDPVTGKNIRIQVKRASTGALIRNIRVDMNTKPHQMVAMGDVNGNGSTDIALSEVNATTGKNVQVQVKDAATGAKIVNIRLNPNYKPHALVVLADVNGNGSPDIALSESNATTGKSVQIQVKDGRTGVKISNVLVNGTTKPYQLISLGNVNGAGSPADLALLEVNPTTGKNVQIQVKDALTGGKIRNIPLNPNYSPLGMNSAPDSNGNGVQELGVLEQDAAGKVQIQVKDALTGGLIKNQPFPHL